MGMSQVVGLNDPVGEGDEYFAPHTFAREVLDWMTFEETGVPREELPRPTLWRVLVLPKQPKVMSKGGIAIPAMAQEAEQHLNYIGQVVMMGPLAGKNEKFQNPDWTVEIGAEVDRMGTASSDINALKAPKRYLFDVKVGDWVIYGRYSGMHIEYKGLKLLTLNDDDITSVITSPDGFKIHL